MTEQDTTTPTTKPSWAPPQPLEYWVVRLKLANIVSSKPEGYGYDRREGKQGELSCLYWHKGEDSDGGEPGCIIGHLLADLGAPAEFLAACDDSPKGSALDQVIKEGMLDGVFEDRTALALRHLQTQQDSGRSWARAMESMDDFWAGLRALEYHQAAQAKQ